MKIPLMYGVAIAVGGALLNLAMFFAGVHDNPERIQSGIVQTISVVVPLAIAITCISLAMRDKRAITPPEANWSYGSALGTGTLVALFASLFGAVASYVYYAFINPNVSDIIYQAQVATMTAKGMTPDQIERAGGVMRKMLSPAVMTIFQTVMGFAWNFILSLIIAIFFRQRRNDGAEATLVPPPLA